MMLVALVFGELASEYPLSGALYQYGKYSVGPRYGWFIGWIYGFALLATVASVDSGAVGYVTSLSNIWFGTHLDPANHLTIFADHGRDHRALGDRSTRSAQDHGAASRASACTSRRSERSASFLRSRSTASTRSSASSLPRRASSSPSTIRWSSISAATGGPAPRWSRSSPTCTSSSASNRPATSPKRRLDAQPPSSQSDAQRAALRRHRVVRAGARIAARDAGERHRRAS